MSEFDLAWAALAALAAGFINAVAGGGTLITFPVLMALGISPVAANITNTIALCPGYFGGSYAQRRELKPQQRRLTALLPLGILGGLAGSLILIFSPEKAFRELVPFLILVATLLLALQPLLKKIIRPGAKTGVTGKIFLGMAVFAAAVYGGYFGAGLGVILISVLTLLFPDPLPRLNALKQALSLSINLTAAIYFCFSPEVEWWFVGVMTFSALLGGNIGGRTAGKLNPVWLRRIIVLIGFTLSVYYFIEYYLS